MKISFEDISGLLKDVWQYFTKAENTKTIVLGASLAFVGVTMWIKRFDWISIIFLLLMTLLAFPLFWKIVSFLFDKTTWPIRRKVLKKRIGKLSNVEKAILMYASLTPHDFIILPCTYIVRKLLKSGLVNAFDTGTFFNVSLKLDVRRLLKKEGYKKVFDENFLGFFLANFDGYLKELPHDIFLKVKKDLILKGNDSVLVDEIVPVSGKYSEFPVKRREDNISLLECEILMLAFFVVNNSRVCKLPIVNCMDRLVEEEYLRIISKSDEEGWFEAEINPYAYDFLMNHPSYEKSIYDFAEWRGKKKEDVKTLSFMKEFLEVKCRMHKQNKTNPWPL